MKNKFLIPVFLVAAIFAAIGWYFQKDNSTYPAASLRTSDSPRFKIASKPISARIPQQASAQDVADKILPYEKFKERRICFHNSGAPESISQEIAILQVDIKKASADFKVALENEVRRKKDQLSILAKCGNTPVTKDELSRLLEEAARQGSRDAQIAYALDPMIDQDHSIENLDRLRTWRDMALTYVQAAVDTGNLEAMIALAGAYDPHHCQASNDPCPGTMLGQIVNPDAKTAYRYYYDAKLTGRAPPWVEAELNTLREYLTPDQIEEAQRAASSAIPKLQ